MVFIHKNYPFSQVDHPRSLLALSLACAGTMPRPTNCQATWMGRLTAIITRLNRTPVCASRCNSIMQWNLPIGSASFPLPGEILTTMSLVLSSLLNWWIFRTLGTNRQIRCAFRNRSASPTIRKRREHNGGIRLFLVATLVSRLVFFPSVSVYHESAFMFFFENLLSLYEVDINRSDSHSLYA